MIKNLVFDFGHVMVTCDFKRFAQMHLTCSPAEMRELEYLVFRDFVNLCDREVVPLDHLLRFAQQAYPHLAGSLQAFFDHFDDFITGEMPGLCELLQTLKARGYKLYGLSNWHSKVYGVMERYPIFSLLDGRVISCEEKLLKPEPEIYQRLFQRYGLLPSECLFADDKRDNVEASIAQGMDAVVFTDTEHYAAELRKRGIL